MLGNPKYRKRWKKKLQWHRDNGILPYKEGGGPNGMLVMTRDDPKGGIDSYYIDALVGKVFQL